MLYLYDKSLELKLKNVLPPKQVVFAPVDRFYERYLMANDNRQVEFPAVSLWRTNFVYHSAEARAWLGTTNRIVNPRDDSKGLPIATSIQSIPVDLHYSLDLWANTDVDRDDLMTELLYFLTLYPNVHIPYQNQDYVFPLIIGEPEDLTDISQFEDGGGNTYRASIPLSIEGARVLYHETLRLARFVSIDMSNVEVDGRLRRDGMISLGPDGRVVHDGTVQNPEGGNE